MVSILRNVSLTVLLKSGKLKVLRYLNKHYSFYKKTQHIFYTTVNNRGYILHKVGYKKGRKHDYDVYKKNHPVIPKEVVCS